MADSLFTQRKNDYWYYEKVLMVRVIGDKIENEHVRPIDFTKKPMKEFAYVSQDGFKTEIELFHYIELGFEHTKNKL
ncbi:hypothetical protein [Lacinutrix sp. Bg11-31]|uniref:hypothetical protein n=1 Tax=Lacinutrix sp. Bg11-31 TaxID=2057808 RepID=UPI000C310811|nr:hypothetical protein [Lacinutrix sp. Bg11-31]AUC81557.1 hypothetical protein CW733_05175 [Lacinutrix sp. Bg11-31]